VFTCCASTRSRQFEGEELGDSVGEALELGDELGDSLGTLLSVGNSLGIELGGALPDELGLELGWGEFALGIALGDPLGLSLGELLGLAVGDELGLSLGEELGNKLGPELREKRSLGAALGAQLYSTWAHRSSNLYATTSLNS
jgi:hypothetical protein